MFRGDAMEVKKVFFASALLLLLAVSLYIGADCDLIWKNGEVCAAVPGKQLYFFWNGEDFERGVTGEEYTQAEITITPVDSIPFEPKYMEELQIEGPRKVSYSKISVTFGEGFVEIPNVGDVLQLYTADNEMIADNYYYGRPWRLPANLLYGRECYLAVSELKDDFYKEY